MLRPTVVVVVVAVTEMMRKRRRRGRGGGGGGHSRQKKTKPWFPKLQGARRKCWTQKGERPRPCTE